MSDYSKSIQIKWADIDANNHLRHSAFYDFGAWLRIVFLADQGITMKWLQDNHVGPILFREEAIFKREIRFEDEVTINVESVRARHDYSRWSLRHTFVKADGTVAALLNVDGAFFNTQERKLLVPEGILLDAFQAFPKTTDFEWVEVKPK